MIQACKSSEPREGTDEKKPVKYRMVCKKGETAVTRDFIMEFVLINVNSC